MTEMPESVFLAPPMTPYAGSSAGTPLAGILRGRVRSDDEESAASASSFSSTTSRGRKRGIDRTTPEILEDLVISVAYIGAELMFRAEEIMREATTSSNLKGTFVKILKEATSSIFVGSMELEKWSGTAASAGEVRLLESRLCRLEEENTVLRKELAGRGVRSP
jgi:hypothetical protein